MVTYTVLADARESEFQNMQELAAIWGEIRASIAELDGELIDAYAVLGDYDYQMTYEAPDEETAMQIAFVIERFGLDTHTHQVIEVDRLGELVEDI
jgi:uncharacterized protein with GYD domain